VELTTSGQRVYVGGKMMAALNKASLGGERNLISVVVVVVVVDPIIG
jgi:hypothetical protein